MVPNYIIESDYNPIKLNTKEIKEFDYKRIRILRTFTFCNRTKCIIYKLWFKTIAFYTNLVIDNKRETDILNNIKKINILENKKE
jgi:hypothetical protein